jgi:transglutaminase-like putative cysteine protease
MTHLDPTPILDFGAPTLNDLIQARAWRALPVYDRIGAVYRFVRDEIPFGYNASDDLPASRVLADGYGQCNTKTNLLMALLRGVGVPCRFHGATIHKALQKGVVTGFAYAVAPRSILHGYAEVLYDGVWRSLEGVILDANYLSALRVRFPSRSGAFLGYGVGTTSLCAPNNEWRGQDTDVQQTGISADYGVFDSPDAFYAKHGTNLSGLRAWMFRVWVRAVLNRRVQAIRAAGESTPETRETGAVQSPRA